MLQHALETRSFSVSHWESAKPRPEAMMITKRMANGPALAASAGRLNTRTAVFAREKRSCNRDIQTVAAQ